MDERMISVEDFFLHGDIPCVVMKVDWNLPRELLGLTRTPKYHWVAYIAVPRGHPWYGHDARSGDSTFNDVQCHGGVTYAGHGLALDESDERLTRVNRMGGWWIGMDFSHWADHDDHGNPRHTIEHVRTEVRDLADQALAVISGKSAGELA